MNLPQVDSRHLNAFSKSFEHELSVLKISSKVFNISEGGKPIETERLMFIYSDFDPDVTMSMNLTHSGGKDQNQRDLSVRFLLKKQGSPAILWQATVRLLANGEKFLSEDFERFGQTLVLRMLKDGVISNGTYAKQIRPQHPVPDKPQPILDKAQAIYIHIDGINYGPYSRLQIDSMLANHRLYLEDWAWREGESGWSMLKELINKY